MKYFGSMTVTMLVLCSLNGFSASSPAQQVKLIYDSDAVISVAPEGSDGGAHRIAIDGKSYLIDPLQSARESFEAIVGNHQFHHVAKTQPGQAVGFVVREKGHFPNPTVVFDVFKAVDLSFSNPRGGLPTPETEQPQF